jgi:NAD(P)-dependent dehydrogenase (short-subunit alcohol dehydrogenase family)
MTISLHDKTALITGAGRGQGHAIALALAQAGARVIAIDVNPDTVERTAALIGPTASAHTADVSNKMAVQTLLYSILETDTRLDILVNAAHVTPGSPALKLDEWEWNRTVDVNLKGAFLMAQTGARAMKETGGGVIINIARPAQASPHAAVRAAREGLVGLTNALANEWQAFNVRVVLVEASEAEVTAAQVLKLCGGV